MRQLLYSFFRSVLFGFITLALASAANAQFKASIQGTVTDPSDAVVSGATVTITNQETSKSQQTTTSDEGFYRVSGLAPGTYTVTAEITGFKKKVLENVAVHAEETQGLNLALDAGLVSESVTVTPTADTTQLDRENPSLDRTITTQEVRRIPQAGRDPYELIRLTPGVFGDSARGANGNSTNLPNTTGPGGSNSSIFQTENQVPISANGQRVSANNFQIDGVSVNSLAHGGAAVVTPNQESVKEMRVISSAYSAEYGRNSGAQIQVVSQNGTNDLHGSAFFKYTDPGLSPFNKFGDIFGAGPQRVERPFRQFGGSLGGPIVKDKLFFFFSYEAARENNQSTASRFIETAEFRQLIASRRPNSLIAQVFSAAGIEPRTAGTLTASCVDFIAQGRPCAVINGRLDIGSLPGSTGQDVGLGNPRGGGLGGVPAIELALIPTPNQLRGRQFNGRVDFNPNSNDQFAVSAYFTKLNNFNSDIGAQGRPIADIRV